MRQAQKGREERAQDFAFCAAHIAPRRDVAMGAADVHAMGQCGVLRKAEGWRQKFYADILRPIMRMGQNGLTRLEATRTAQRNHPTRSTHYVSLALKIVLTALKGGHIKVSLADRHH